MRASTRNGLVLVAVLVGAIVGVATAHPLPRTREGGLSPASMGAALGVSGTNTGDQTKTCSADTYLSTLAAGTSSVCLAIPTAAGWTSDGGNTSTTQSATVTNGPLNVGVGGIATDGGIVAGMNSNSALTFANGRSIGATAADSSWIYSYNFRPAVLYADGWISAGSSVSAGTFAEAVTYLRSIGVTTGSLPSCNAALRGAIETDTTLGCAKFCDGSAWKGFTVPSDGGTCP